MGKFKAPVEQVEEFLSPVLEWGMMVKPAPVAPDACRDADDLLILGTALAATVDLLVTGDKDPLILGSFQRIAIISPREFCDRFMAG
jgi:predicted nucleic acid-binding protein